MLVQRGVGGKCDFEAIFNFGDSNSDTGGYFSAFPSQGPPNGMTYFKRPTGRPSDGRMYLDFLAQALGLPFVSPYLQSLGSDFRHGANFATSLSTVLQPNGSLLELGVSPFSLAIQLNQMKHFKSIVDEKSPGSEELPSPDIFGKSLFTISIGQNDFTIQLIFNGINGTKQTVPQIVSQISSTIKELHGLGIRTFIVLNLSPIGCYPLYISRLPHGASDIDQYGCMVNYKNAVDEFNNMLKESLNQTGQDLGDAKVIYVNTHDVLTELFQHPKNHGFQEGTKACCGLGGGTYNYNPEVSCGTTKLINGQNVTATACDDPQNYVDWDGVHITEAANKQLAYAILNGSYSDPPFKFSDYCEVQPLS
ncbi:hypothetical protein Leryth_026925 [Lithospermum erythrorhizon]|nr:hypothetical protein Leryth_026925 [Lithospermum erythrorhizon]